MTLSEDNKRQFISGAASLLIHVGLLLIPIAATQLPPGEAISGYIASLVQIPESSGVSSGAKPAVTGESAPVVVPKKTAPKQAKITPPPATPSPADIRAEKKEPEEKKETAATIAGNGGNGTARSEQGTVGDGQGTGPAAPARPALGDGKGQIVSGTLPAYPKAAQNEMSTGTVRYRLHIDPDGQLRSAENIISSGDKRLDDAVYRQINRSWRFATAEVPYFLELDFIFSADGKVRAEHVRAGWEDEL
ncbi:MAG TPA: TonB family protein [Bacillota bacterium]|jgi:TonB family protein|nr:TonB family protein [Bacillota bacterium]HPT66977.1 TonB family protein [Bacillota bacterium]